MLLVAIPGIAVSQVQLRDSTISWMQHSFRLNADYSMDFYSTADNYLHQAQFQAKVLENEFIRLVIIPEYGARVISFVYKPTGHEYLYQSACGSPYGINEGNFYYNWLMVYGGIFPTFPEPEHGKTWLLAWDYEVVKNTGDSVVIAMEYTDNMSFNRAPGKFNNGTTNITCRVEVGVFAGASLWDFNVSLKNNKNEKVKYEYWTCTSLTPGSDIGDTGCPLNTEMIAPISQYRADWSPGNWIGSYRGVYDFARINFLSKWNDMGIAYAVDLHDNYWGVINHENQEGIFRISENVETPGMKFWTWGKNNIDNNLFDFSNGGADNYIELWAGVSESFFSDATLDADEEISWSESYGPTAGLRSVTKIDRNFAVNLDWKKDANTLNYELMAFKPSQTIRLSLYLIGDGYYSVVEKAIVPEPLGNSESHFLNGVPAGEYTAYFEIFDQENEKLFTATKAISTLGSSSVDPFSTGSSLPAMIVQAFGEGALRITLPEEDTYQVRIFSLNGQEVLSQYFTGNSMNLNISKSGMLIIQVTGTNQVYSTSIISR